MFASNGSLTCRIRESPFTLISPCICTRCRWISTSLMVSLLCFSSSLKNAVASRCHFSNHSERSTNRTGSPSPSSDGRLRCTPQEIGLPDRPVVATWSHHTEAADPVQLSLFRRLAEACLRVFPTATRDRIPSSGTISIKNTTKQTGEYFNDKDLWNKSGWRRQSQKRCWARFHTCVIVWPRSG